jgi:hypothetical protein
MHALTLPALERRLSRKIETRKGIQLTPDELDLLVETGAYDTFRQAVAKFQREQCRQRSARSRSIKGGNSGSIAGKGGRPSKSSGTTPPESASEALARARLMSGRGG